MPIYAADGSERGAGPGPLRVLDAPVSDIPEPFRRAVARLASVPHRRGLRLTEVPAPRSAAPFAVALGGESRPDLTGAQTTGRFMLLHDPSSPSSWGGDFRVVAYVRADLDEAMGNDPLLAPVAWDWLNEALESSCAQVDRLGGHATRVLTESFGTLDHRFPTMDIELRASWTPRGDLEAHLHAWQNVLAAFAGLPPEQDGVSTIPGLRYT